MWKKSRDRVDLRQQASANSMRMGSNSSMAQLHRIRDRGWVLWSPLPNMVLLYAFDDGGLCIHCKYTIYSLSASDSYQMLPNALAPRLLPISSLMHHRRHGIRVTSSAQLAYNLFRIGTKCPTSQISGNKHQLVICLHLPRGKPSVLPPVRLLNCKQASMASAVFCIENSRVLFPSLPNPLPRAQHGSSAPYLPGYQGMISQ